MEVFRFVTATLRKEFCVLRLFGQILMVPLPTRVIYSESDEAASLEKKLAFRVSSDQTTMFFKIVGAARPFMIFWLRH